MASSCGLQSVEGQAAGLSLSRQTGQHVAVPAPGHVPEERHDIKIRVIAADDFRWFAEELVISPRTVQNHLTRIHEKTGLRRRSELTRWAVEHAISS
jgi:FixJ family two-component response regulator